MDTIYDNALIGSSVSYQGWYATIIYNIALMLIPIPYARPGLVILQLIVLAYVAAYVANYILEKYGKKLAICSAFIFIAPPALFFSQFTMRETWFAYSLVLLCAEIDRFLNGEKNYFRFCLSTILTTIFRPEAVYLAIVIIVFLIFYKKISKEIKLRMILAILVSLMILNTPQKNGNEYRSTPFINPLSGMITADGFKWYDQEKDEEAISKVIDVEALKRHSSITDLEVVHEEIEAWNKDFTDAEYKAFVITYIRLVLKNPLIFLKVRSLTFIYTVAIGTYGCQYFSDWLGINSMIVRLGIGATLYNASIPLFLLLITAIKRRDIKSILYLFVVGGEASAIFILVTSIEFMFHFTFLLASWMTVLILWASRLNNK